MKKRLSSAIASLLFLVILSSVLLAFPANADPSPAFLGRGGEAYELKTDNADGSATIQTVTTGGGVKSVKSYQADGLAVDLTFSADDVASLPAGNQYILAFTNTQHATPNGDDSTGFYFVFTLHDPDAGLQGIIADIFPTKKPISGGSSQITGTSRYLPLSEQSTFLITKKENGNYTISLSNKYYAEPTLGNQILFDDVDLAACIGAQGLYVNMYLAAGSNFNDSYTINVTGTEPSAGINGFMPYGQTVLSASGTTAVSFTNPAVGQGAYTVKRVKLDGVQVTMRYDGDMGDANGYLLAFSNVGGSNMLSNETRQKGFYFVIRFHDNLGVADENDVTSGVIIRENVKKNANGVAVSFPESEKKEEFSQGRFLRESDTVTLKFVKVDGNRYNMYYSDDYSQTEDLLMLENVDFTDYLDTDGHIYVNYFLADIQQPDQMMTFTFGVDGEYTDAPSEPMPDIEEEGDPVTLPDINGFTFTPSEVLNANAQALSYNGLTMTGKTFRVTATQTVALPVNGLEFELTTATGAASGSYYLISLAKQATMLARDEASIDQGFLFTLQCAADAQSGIYNIFGWNGNQSLGAGISKRFSNDVPARLKITKAEDGTYTLWYKGDAALAYEVALSGMDLTDCIAADGKAYFSIRTMDTMIDANYQISLLSLPIPAAVAQAKIDETKDLDPKDYTEDSWQEFEEARTALQAAIDSEQEYLNDLYQTFLAALLNLQEQDPMVLLYEQLLKDIESNFEEDKKLVESKYDAKAWKDFMQAKKELTEWLEEGVGYETLKPYYDKYIEAKQALLKTESNVQTGSEPVYMFLILLAVSATGLLFFRKKTA